MACLTISQARAFTEESCKSPSQTYVKHQKLALPLFAMRSPGCYLPPLCASSPLFWSVKESVSKLLPSANSSSITSKMEHDHALHGDDSEEEAGYVAVYDDEDGVQVELDGGEAEGGSMNGEDNEDEVDDYEQAEDEDDDDEAAALPRHDNDEPDLDFDPVPSSEDTRTEEEIEAIQSEIQELEAEIDIGKQYRLIDRLGEGALACAVSLYLSCLFG